MPRIFLSLPVLQGKNRGFSIFETLLVILMVSVIIGVLFYTLNTGQQASQISSVKAEVQSEVRRAVDWISKDARQTTNTEIASVNTPTQSYIKFRPVCGYNTTTQALELGSSCSGYSTNWIQYSFNQNAMTITRYVYDSTGNLLGSWIFNNIIQAPFFTKDLSGNTISLTNNQSSLLTSGKLVIIAVGSKNAFGALNITSALTAEVKVRNNY